MSANIGDLYDELCNIVNSRSEFAFADEGARVAMIDQLGHAASALGDLDVYLSSYGEELTVTFEITKIKEAVEDKKRRSVRRFVGDGVNRFERSLAGKLQTAGDRLSSRATAHKMDEDLDVVEADSPGGFNL